MVVYALANWLLYGISTRNYIVLNKLSHMAQVYYEIRKNNIRRLNWRAMKYYVKRGMYLEAAECRDVCGPRDKNGPV